MAVLSKNLFFEQFVSRRGCNELLHSNSCKKSALINVPHFLLSNAKFYFPSVLLQVLMKSKKMNVKILQDIMLDYARLTLGGFLTGYTIAVSMCIFRNMLGKFYPSTILFIPSLLGGVTNIFGDARAQKIQYTAIFQFVIESLLVQRGNFVTKSIFDSEILQTLILMCCSVLILDAKQRFNHKDFWFLKAERASNAITSSEQNDDPSLSSNTTACNHTGKTCMRNTLEGMRSYILLGLALDSFKMVLSKPRFKKLRLSTTGLLTGYIGIYRACNCFLNQHYASNGSLNHLLAAFLGGSAFAFYPNVTIVSYAILQAWQIFVKYHLKVKTRKGISYGDVVFPFALAYLIHISVLRPKEICRLGANMLNGATANYGQNITKRLRQFPGFE